METTPLLQKEAKCPVDVTKNFVEPTPAYKDFRHYRKTPGENLITEQAYSPTTSKLFSAAQSSVQFYSLLVSCHIIIKTYASSVQLFTEGQLSQDSHIRSTTRTGQPLLCCAALQ